MIFYSKITLLVLKLNKMIKSQFYFFNFTTSLRERISSETKQPKSQIVVSGSYQITVSEILYCRNLIYDLLSAIIKQLENYDYRCQKKITIVEFPSQVVSMSSQSSIYWRVVVNSRDKKVFQGFPKFHRSEYLIFQSVNKTLFTPACDLLDNSLCLYIVYIYSYYMLSRVFSNWFLKNRSTFFTLFQMLPKNLYSRPKSTMYYFTHY